MAQSTRRCSGRSDRGSRRWSGRGAGDAPRLPPGTAKTVQIVVDGETCLEQRLRRLFRGAILTLDIRHAQEKLWEAGRLFHREGSAELTRWVEELVDLLYKGHVRALLGRLEQAMRGISLRGPGTKEKRKVLGSRRRWSSRRLAAAVGSWRGWRTPPAARGTISSALPPASWIRKIDITANLEGMVGRAYPVRPGRGRAGRCSTWPLLICRSSSDSRSESLTSK